MSFGELRHLNAALGHVDAPDLSLQARQPHAPAVEEEEGAFTLSPLAISCQLLTACRAR